MAKKGTKKSGRVYFGESVRKSGRAEEYVGGTSGSVKKREARHQSDVRNPNSKSWVGRGTSYKTTRSFPSKNWRKAEKTVKRNRRAAYSKGNYRSKYSKK